MPFFDSILIFLAVLYQENLLASSSNVAVSDVHGLISFNLSGTPINYVFHTL